MGTINLKNSKGRDAMVKTRHVATSLRLRWLDDSGRQAQSVRICRAPLDYDLQALLARTTASEPLSALGQSLIDGDPEVDLERTGGFLRDNTRVYVDADQKVVRALAMWDVVHNADGSVRERRPQTLQEQNVATATPLHFSGKFLKKSEVWNRFVFATKLQVLHVNGLTYDFLFEMARELEQKDCLLLVGAGKTNQPLVFQRGGTPYRGFLEGRTRGDSYCLILHLSNQELKATNANTDKASPSSGKTAP